jgi:type IV secretion system protein VirD4
MVSIPILIKDSHLWLQSFGINHTTEIFFRDIGLFLKSLSVAFSIVVFLFISKEICDEENLKVAGYGALVSAAIYLIFIFNAEIQRIKFLAYKKHIYPSWNVIISVFDGHELLAIICALGISIFSLSVGIKGVTAFPVYARRGPKYIKGKRAIYGKSEWLTLNKAKKIFPEDGDIIIGERCRVDEDSSIANKNFDPNDKATWGQGGKSPLLGFKADFGSTHGLVFAGSGAFKTTSVIVPTALKYQSSMVILDPSTEVASLVKSEQKKTKNVFILDPKTPEIGFNVLDWIGEFSSAPEEDIATVAAWIMSEKPRVSSGSDDFFRTSAEQFIVAILADIILGNTPKEEQTLRTLRIRLSEPEEPLRKKLQDIYDNAPSRFVKENIAPFINMTPQTFSGVYATAAKETHWLSYENYAALVSGNSFKTKILSEELTSIFINLDFDVLENHPGIARVIVGALLKSVYSKNGNLKYGRVLFLLDEVARLGYMRLLETTRDVGRKYGITLLLSFQSLSQIKDSFGQSFGKWFESASWISFAALNDLESARYVSERCGTTTVEVDHKSESSRGFTNSLWSSSSSQTYSKQLAAKKLMMPEEVLDMRSDEQIIFTRSNPPLRCGRAMYFRRKDMMDKIGERKFS